ncbi:MAG: Gfo/Idh/MocA family protein [Aestuariibacter sp.]
MKKLRWGIIATGKIAHTFVQDLQLSSNSQITAVTSRQLHSAQAFAEQYGIPNAFSDIQEMLHHPEVDVVYVATPHPYHKDAVLTSLASGVHVLCEKPLTLNSSDTYRCIEAARKQQLFLMEAVWMRFFPAIHKAKQLLEDGAIGTPQMLDAAFCFNKPFDAKHRLFSPELGGGALLDLGIYPISLAQFLFGKPLSWTGHCLLGETGVDDFMDVTFEHENSVKAFLRASSRFDAPITATIVGTQGNIYIHERFHHPAKITLAKHHQAPETFDFAYSGNGYQFEIAEVERCLKSGKTESSLMSWQDTLTTMEIMDDLRKQWGIQYPGE